MRTIKVRFAAGNQAVYSYFVPEGDNPEVGDLVLTSIGMAPAALIKRSQGRSYQIEDGDEEVIVATPKIGTVVDVEKVENRKATKFYMQLLSARQIRARQDENKVIAAKIKIKRDVEAQLDAILNEQDKADRYASLAEVNPEARKLLDMLNELSPAAIAAPTSVAGGYKPKFDYSDAEGLTRTPEGERQARERAAARKGDPEPGLPESDYRD